MQSITHETTARGSKTSQALVLLGKQHKSLLWSLSVLQAGKQSTSVNFSIHPFQNNKNNLSCLKLCFLLIILETCSCFYFVFIYYYYQNGICRSTHQSLFYQMFLTHKRWLPEMTTSYATSQTSISWKYSNYQEAGFTLYHHFLFKQIYKSSCFRSVHHSLRRSLIPSFPFLLKSKTPHDSQPGWRGEQENTQFYKYFINYFSAKHIPLTEHCSFKSQCFAICYGKEPQQFSGEQNPVTTSPGTDTPRLSALHLQI